jgi:hypothetical protein
MKFYVLEIEIHPGMALSCTIPFNYIDRVPLGTESWAKLVDGANSISDCRMFDERCAYLMTFMASAFPLAWRCAFQLRFSKPD